MFITDPGEFAKWFKSKFPGEHRVINSQDILDMTECGLIGRYSTSDADELISFKDELKKFEEQHPDVSAKDLVDTSKKLDGDTPFVQKINNLKQNLVTIERTSGCRRGLISVIVLMIVQKT